MFEDNGFSNCRVIKHLSAATGRPSRLANAAADLA